MKSILFLLAILLFATPSVAQTHFYFDEPFRRPAKIPDGLLPLLRDIAKGCRAEPVNKGTDIKSWFSASKINLRNHRSALILKSAKWCLNGVDNDWFWICWKSAEGYRVVLTGGTISLDVLKTTTHGLRDIETNAATAQTNYARIYKFNGSVYKPEICTEASMHEQNPKPHQVPCRQ